MTHTIDYKDGYLCVRIEDNLDSEPLHTVSWYPIARGPRCDYEHLIGQEAYDDRDGWYSVKTDIGTYGYQRMCCVDGGKTMPIAGELTPIPCPKVRAGIITRYQNSHWEKRLKSGWVTI